MHAADRNTNCVQHNKTHVDKSARCRVNSRPRTHTMTENGARVSEPRHVTKTQDMSAGIQTPRSNMKQGTQTRERATRAHSKPRAHMKTRTGWEYQGSVTKPWITLDRSDRTLTLPPPPQKGRQEQDRNMTAQEHDYTKTDTQQKTRQEQSKHRDK